MYNQIISKGGSSKCTKRLKKKKKQGITKSNFWHGCSTRKQTVQIEYLLYKGGNHDKRIGTRTINQSYYTL